MAQTQLAYHIPFSGEVVLLLGIVLAPCHFGGGGSSSSYSFAQGCVK